ncbi:MAG: chaperone protein DnaJ 2 [Phycisphaerae bacterium]|nr:MAG: chaperone protein DnaJ 2 [Phycisphaerae bacterium]
MAEKDYYAVLGVSRSATMDDIRKAYRALARQYHPDVNKSPNATAKFNEVQQAYDVLADEQKRRLYDQYGPGGVNGAGPFGGTGTRPRSSGGGHPGSAMPDMDSEELSELFESIFGGSSPFERTHPSPGRGPGRARPGRASPGTTEAELSISFETAARGGSETVRLSGRGAPRTIEVRIPAGIEDGSVLRVRGGHEHGVKVGDVEFRVRIGKHPVWRRGEHEDTGKGLDLYTDVPVSFAHAALGGVVTVPTLSGSVELTIPAGSASGRKLRLRGRGIVDPAGRQGDLYAVVRIVPPRGPFSKEEEAVLRAMDGRTPGVAPSGPGA